MPDSHSSASKRSPEEDEKAAARIPFSDSASGLYGKLQLVTMGKCWVAEWLQDVAGRGDADPEPA